MCRDRSGAARRCACFLLDLQLGGVRVSYPFDNNFVLIEVVDTCLVQSIDKRMLAGNQPLLQHIFYTLYHQSIFVTYWNK